MSAKKVNGRKAKSIVIWGAGGHASVVADIIRTRREWEIVGFIDNINSERQGRQFCGCRILKGGEVESLLDRHKSCEVVIAVGECQARLELGKVAERKGFRLATVIHPKAMIARGAKVGAGTVVAAGAVINPGCVIGENVIINTRASVDHDCVIEDGAHICPGVTLGGHVSIGQVTWVGIGSTVIEKIRIGSYCLVGAASLVLKDIPDGVVAYGTPARVIRNTNVTRSYGVHFTERRSATRANAR